MKAINFIIVVEWYEGARGQEESEEKGSTENWIKSFQDLSTIFMTPNFRLYADAQVHVLCL